jgi:hypothetical protein
MNRLHCSVLSLFCLGIAASGCAVDASSEATATTHEALSGNVTIALDPDYGLAPEFPGLALTDPSITRLSAVASQGSRGTVVVGSAGETTQWFFVQRFTTDGIPDDLFGLMGNSVVTISGSTVGATATAVATDSQERILVAGDYFSDYGGVTQRCVEVARLTVNGLVDETFGWSGVASVCGDTGWIGDANGMDGFTAAVTPLPDGSVAVVGQTEHDGASYSNVVVFSETGVAQHHGYGMHGGMVVTSAQPTAGGQIVVAGGWCITTNCSIEYVALERFDENGSMDVTYNDGEGILLAGQGQALALTSTAGGEMIAVGTTPVSVQGQEIQEGITARVTASGVLDPTWGKSGTGMTQTQINGYASTTFSSVASLSDGSVLVLTQDLVEFSLGILHFTPNGILNPGADGFAPPRNAVGLGLAVHDYGAWGHAEIAAYGWLAEPEEYGLWGFSLE